MIAAWKAVEREGELAYAITDADTFTAAQQSPTSSGKKEKKKKKTQKKSGKKLVAGPTATSTTATATATSTPTATAVSATPSQLYETWIGHAEAAFHREHMLPRLRLPQGELLEIVEMAKRAVVVRASSRAVVERCLPKLTYIDLSYRDLIVGEDATNILTTHLKEIAAAAGVPVQVWLRAADDDRVRYRLESVKLLQFQLSQAEVVRQVLHELTYNSARPSIWAFVGKTNVVVLFDQDHDGERRENFE
ncbi:uncharacterized protein ACA1_389610 [Acanthamoeba castellanii str. Neff]|uniref:Uncharacterized protein n=1 Tax=Acanthamoeba castellanii (strain ATCC 30010 / Neff) TaxID=1257118 RepID=L8GDP2_ACACF|nr:uncharacterized protein ACA1_389610 [Acanthamoeba castellanii str. Neff]ELR11240.1 hypothetical protein ACA1_389610 [Acanthamoeba castellanii str. Neff]